MLEPEIWRERRVASGGDDAVFERVSGCEAENAHGFHAHVLIGRSVDDRWIGIVGYGARQNIGGAAAGMSDADKGQLDALKRAVEVKIQVGELRDADFVVDLDHGVNFFAAVSVGLEANLRFKKRDLRRKGRFAPVFRVNRCPGFLRSILGARDQSY